MQQRRGRFCLQRTDAAGNFGLTVCSTAAARFIPPNLATAAKKPEVVRTYVSASVARMTHAERPAAMTYLSGAGRRLELPGAPIHDL
jgi:hypothetical protein